MQLIRAPTLLQTSLKDFSFIRERLMGKPKVHRLQVEGLPLALPLDLATTPLTSMEEKCETHIMK